MSSSNKSSNDADKNINHAKLCSPPPTDKTAVNQSSTISAKSKKSCFVMYTNETLSDKRNQKQKNVSTKNNLKKQTSFISKTTDDSQSIAFNVNDEMIKENVIEKQTELTDQSKKPEPDAANQVGELTEIDINILSTDSAKIKVPIPKRKRQEMEATAPNDAINLSVSKKSNSFSNTRADKTVEAEKKSTDKAIINTSPKTNESLTAKEIESLFETSKDDHGLKVIEVSSVNNDAQLVFNKLLTSELENSLLDSNLGITLVWESKQFGVRFFAPYAFVEQEELFDLSEVDKVFSTNPTTKHSGSDSIAKHSKIKAFGYKNIVHFHDKIEELFDANQKTFQKFGKPSKFSAGDYFIRNCTTKHIKVFACALHKITSLNCVLTLLQTKAIELGQFTMRPIIMANRDPKTVQFTNKMATVDGYYFAEDCYSMNINEEMANKYIQICKMITPEFYDIMGVYLENYKFKQTANQLQPALTKLGGIYKKHFKKDQLRNAQLRRYLNTIHNYYLKKRINFSTGNTYNELIDVYESLMTEVKSYNSVSSIDYINEALKNPKVVKDLNVEKHDLVISPQVCKKIGTGAKNMKAVLDKKINEKLFCFNKINETQLNQKYNDLEERLNKKDQTIKEQQELIINFYNKIETALCHINFNESSILQLVAEFKASMVEVSGKKKHKKMKNKTVEDSDDIFCKMLSVLEAMNDKMMNKTVGNSDDNSCKILSVLEAMNDKMMNKTVGNSDDNSCKILSVLEAMNEINESLKKLSLNK